LLGQNALSYVVLSGMATVAQRRLLWFPLREQALQILPLFVIAALVEWVTRLIAQDAWPVWSQVLGPLLQAALWPLVGALLLAPQRRAFERDDIRPL
jgi:rod shape-determining protein MreD